jgi:hypothetical protein
VKEPAVFKFFYYWLRQTDILRQTKKNMRLNDLNEELMDEMIEKTGISGESINYKKNAD